jgi:phage shock protein A
MAQEPYGRHARRDEPDETLEVLDAEVVPASPGPLLTSPDAGYSPSGIPTFDSVREKIENRYGASLGSAELDAETPEGRTVAEQYEARHKAASERLAQIRAEMHPDQAPTGDRGKA